MAVSEHETGTKTSDGTPQTLNTTTPDLTDGAFQLFVDLATMVNDDEITLRIYEKARSGGAKRLVWSASYRHIQARPLSVSPPLILLHGWDMELEKTAGAATAFPWSIRKA